MMKIRSLFFPLRLRLLRGVLPQESFYSITSSERLGLPLGSTTTETSMPKSNMSTAVQYSYALPFEKNFEIATFVDQRHFLYKAACCAAVAYLFLVYFGQAYMKKRAAYDLRSLLVVWNTGLALMSIWGTTRILPELFHALRYFGFRYSMCEDSIYESSPVTGCWYYIFALSKFVELGDTAFVILRKQKLLFVHWFHHSTVLVFGFLLTEDRVPMTRWFVSMNIFVHSIMYSYFALRALGSKLPKAVSMSVTTLQISQMLVGTYISVRGFHFWYYEGDKCAITGRAAKAAVTIYSVYFFLFLHFFFKAYTQPGFLRASLKKKV